MERGGIQPDDRDEKGAQRSWSGSKPGLDTELAIPGTAGRAGGGIGLTRHREETPPVIGQDWHYGCCCGGG